MKQTVFKAKVLWIITLLLACGRAWAVPSELARHGVIYPAWEHWFQPAAEDSIREAMALPDDQWEKSETHIRPLHKGPHWARFIFENETDAALSVVIEDQWVPTNFIDFHLVQGDRILQQAAGGDRRPREASLFHHRYPVFAASLPPGRSTLYIRYDSDDIPGVRAVVWTPDAFEAHRNRENLLLGGTLGILLVMVLYNLIIYVFVRVQAYLYYAAYVASFLLFELCIQGLASLYVYPSSWINGEAVLITAMVALNFALQFADHFMNAKKHIPGSRSWLRFLQVLCGANAVLSAFFLQAGNLGGMLVNLAGVAWIIVVTIKMLPKDRSAAIVMLSAWGIFLAGNSWTILYFIGLVPAGYGGRWSMLLGADFEVVGLSLGLAQYMSRLRREKTNAELSEARMLSAIDAATRFQEGLLGSIPANPSLRISSFYQPAERIGGDWYDIAMLGQGRYAFIFVGDVTGHGLPATLLSSAVSGCIRSVFYGMADAVHCDPAAVLLDLAQRTNALVCHSGSQQGALMSMIMVGLDLKDMRVTYLNAGHPHPILRSGTQRFLVSRGSLLGMRPDPQFDIRSESLVPGDMLTLYTDGLTECSTQDSHLLSHRDLLAVLATGKSASETAAHFHKLFDHTPGALTDDITVLCVEVASAWTANLTLLSQSRRSSG